MAANQGKNDRQDHSRHFVSAIRAHNSCNHLRTTVPIARQVLSRSNGNYANIEDTRLLTMREMAIIQGFPVDFEFNGAALSNLYRHIGDAVPPLVSYQMACLVGRILGDPKPSPEDCLLSGTHLRKSDVDNLRSHHRDPRGPNSTGFHARARPLGCQGHPPEHSGFQVYCPCQMGGGWVTGCMMSRAWEAVADSEGGVGHRCLT